MTPLEAAWEAVLAAPDDDHALHVLADALMERGDPHGELIRLQLAGDEAGAARHLERHADELLGDARYLAEWSLRFTRGFLATLRVETAADLQKALDRPVSRLLREVRVSSLPVLTQELEPAEPGPIGPAVEDIVRILAAQGPKTISALHFGYASAPRFLSPDTPAGEVHMAPLTSRLVSLEEVQLTMWPTDFVGASSNSLRRLSVDLHNPVRGLGESRFPVLSALALNLPFRRIDLPPPLLAGEVAPRLKALSLSGALWPQQVHDLASSALLRGLTGLEIHAEPETGWYPAMLETIDSFAHLERLSLVADRHHPEWVRAVKTALPQVIIREPQLRL